MSQGKPAGLWRRPLARDYTLVAGAALLLLALLLLDRGFGWFSALPVLFGGLCMAAGWGVGPPLVLLSVLVLLSARGRWGGGGGGLSDLLLAGTLLVYVAAATRLLSLTRHTVPPDARRARRPEGPRVRRRWFLPTTGAVRTAAAPGEVVALLAAAPAFVAAAFLLWVRLSVEPGPGWLKGSENVWHAMLLVWGMALVLTAAYAFLSYLARSQAGPEESLLYLQDQLWAATRGEQRRMNRWVVWRRLRAGRKGERP